MLQLSSLAVTRRPPPLKLPSKAAPVKARARAVSSLEQAIEAHKNALRVRRSCERAEKALEAAHPHLADNLPASNREAWIERRRLRIKAGLNRAHMKTYRAWRAEIMAFARFVHTKPASHETARYAQYLLRAVKGRVGNPLPVAIYDRTLTRMGVTWEQQKDVQQAAFHDFYAAFRALANGGLR